jgi:adenylate cyclase
MLYHRIIGDERDLVDSGRKRFEFLVQKCNSLGAFFNAQAPAQCTMGNPPVGQIVHPGACPPVAGMAVEVHVGIPQLLGKYRPAENHPFLGIELSQGREMQGEVMNLPGKTLHHFLHGGYVTLIPHPEAKVGGIMHLQQIVPQGRLLQQGPQALDILFAFTVKVEFYTDTHDTTPSLFVYFSTVLFFRKKNNNALITGGQLYHFSTMSYNSPIEGGCMEIERKFLVQGAYESLVIRSQHIIQAYISTDPARVVRVRIRDDQGFLTIKGASSEDGLSRYEWEKEIPVQEARELLELRQGGMIDKVRSIIPWGKHKWEVDVFHGENEGLVLAEIELESETDSFDIPDWLGREVTGDVRYYNARLMQHPYSQWKGQ